MCPERKLHSNWRSPADTPSLSPTVVAGLHVRYSRRRSSPETSPPPPPENLFVIRGVREPKFHCICFCPTSVSVLRRICVFTHIWLQRDCIWTTVATKWYYEWNVFTQIGRGAKCWLDVYHWVAGLAATGRIRDIGQNVFKSFLRSSSSSSYCHIFFVSHSSTRALLEM
jgi:hypothetical protein